jgi:hypothetical protein
MRIQFSNGKLIVLLRWVLCAFFGVAVFPLGVRPWTDNAEGQYRSSLERHQTEFGIPPVFFPVPGTASDAKYYSQGAHSRLLLTSQGVSFELWKPSPISRDAIAQRKAPPSSQSIQVRIEFAGNERRDSLKITPLSPAAGQVNYYIGDRKEDWETDIQGYERVKYEEVYPGIDAVFYGSNRRLEYDFVVRPGGAPESILLDFANHEALKLDPSGDLVIGTAAGAILQYKPVAYQSSEAARHGVEASYVLLNEHEVGIAVGEYDHSAPLVIDPVIGFSSYLGGTKEDEANAIAVDEQGFIYVTGFTESVNFPKVSPYQRTKGAYADTFVAKIDTFQGKLVYCTYLGGNLGDGGFGIKADGLGNAYVTGATWSTDFPVLHAYQSRNRGAQDAFLTKLDSTGKLIFSTYFGGPRYDGALAIALDSKNQMYLTGLTESPGFPVKNPVQPKLHSVGGSNAFVSKFSSDGSTLLFSSFLGGGDIDSGYGIAVDPQEKIYVTGWTYSSNFPVVNAFQSSNHGFDDSFVAKIDPVAPRIVYSTYIGGSSLDRVGGIAVSPAGAAVIAGHTASQNFPMRNPIKSSHAIGNFDAFVTKFSPTGRPVFSTYFGGTGSQDAYSVAYDRAGNICLCGRTKSSDFPIVQAVQSTLSLGKTLSFDAFVAKLNPTGSTILFSSYLGGSEDELCFAIAVDQSSRIYVAGFTGSPDFPLRNAFQQKIAGNSVLFNYKDVFVTRIDPGSQ